MKMKSVLTLVLTLVGLALLATGMYFLWIEPRETIFVVTAVGAVVGAVIAVTRRSPIYSIVALLAVFLCLALLYWVLGAELLAALQLIVYAGAILMLFLFVIMLFNLDSADPAKEFGEIDVTGRLTAEQAEREASGFLLNTPRVRALILSVLVGVLLIVPILMLEDPPDAALPQWNRFLPLTHEGLSDEIEAQIHQQIRREVLAERLAAFREEAERELRRNPETQASIREEAIAMLGNEALAELNDAEREQQVQQQANSMIAARANVRAHEMAQTEIDTETAARLQQHLAEWAEHVARQLQHKSRGDRDEIITVALGRRIADVMHVQEAASVDELDLNAPVVLRAVRELQAPALQATTRAYFAEQLLPRLEAIGIDDAIRREIFVELAVRGRLGPSFGSIPGVGTELIEGHAISLEFVGLLILAGCVGAAMLARRRLEAAETERTKGSAV